MPAAGVSLPVPTASLVELIILGAVWGGSFLFTRVAGPEFGVPALVAVRVLISMLILLPFVLPASRREKLRGRWGHVIALGLMNTSIPFMLLAYTAVTIGAGFASILNATATLFAAVIARVWLGDKLTVAKVLGLALGIAGVTLLVWDKVHLKPDGLALPVLSGLAGAMLYGLSVNFTKRYTSDIPALTLAGGSQIGAGVMMLPIALAFLPVSMPSVNAWGAAAVLGVVCTGIAYVMFFRLFAKIGASKAITVAFLIPMFGVLWGWLFLHEQVTGVMLGGAALVIGGLGLTTGLIPFPARAA